MGMLACSSTYAAACFKPEAQIAWEVRPQPTCFQNKLYEGRDAGCVRPQALPPGGKLVALDKDAGTMAMAKRYWQEAGVADKVR